MRHDNLRKYVHESWIWPLGKGFDYLKNTILPFLRGQLQEGKEIYPHADHIFRALKETPFDDVRVVIIGQDPYHTPGVATGLAFDVPKGQKPAPSLNNILKVIETDTGAPSAASTNLLSYLEHLPRQGVLLINTALTVEKGKPESHLEIWKPFIELLVDKLQSRQDIVWILWGQKAKKFQNLIKNQSHKIVEGAHPSPFAWKRFQGGKFFTQVNSHLKTNPIVW